MRAGPLKYRGVAVVSSAGTRRRPRDQCLLTFLFQSAGEAVPTMA